MNLLVINFNEEPLRQWSEVSKAKTEYSYILINNGLPKRASEDVFEIFGDLQALGKNVKMVVYSHPKPTGPVFNNQIISVLDDPSIKFLSFVDDNTSGANLDRDIANLAAYPAIASGRTSEEPKLFVHNNLEMCSCDTLDGSWTLNVLNFRNLVRVIAAFNLINAGFEKAFKDEADFSIWFKSIYDASKKLMPNHHPFVI